jgi:hypothetical protein
MVADFMQMQVNDGWKSVGREVLFISKRIHFLEKAILLLKSNVIKFQTWPTNDIQSLISSQNYVFKLIMLMRTKKLKRMYLQKDIIIKTMNH